MLDELNEVGVPGVPGVLDVYSESVSGTESSASVETDLEDE